jgi:hypothetical protein
MRQQKKKRRESEKREREYASVYVRQALAVFTSSSFFTFSNALKRRKRETR